MNTVHFVEEKKTNDDENKDDRSFICVVNGIVVVVAVAPVPCVGRVIFVGTTFCLVEAVVPLVF